MIETSLYRLSSPVGKVGLSAHWWQGCLGGVCSPQLCQRQRTLQEGDRIMEVVCAEHCYHTHFP